MIPFWHPQRRKKNTLIIGIVVLILSACVVSPQARQTTIEPSLTTSPSAPNAVDLGTMGNGLPSAVAWSADGMLMAVASTQGVYLYDAVNWQTIMFIQMPDEKEYRNGITQVWFSLDGKSLYYTYVSTPLLSIYQYSLTSRKTTRLYKELTFSELTTIAFSPDRQIFANVGVAALDEGGKPELLPQIEIRESATGSLLQTLKPDTVWWNRVPVKLISFSPDGTLLAMGASDNIVRIWDIKSGRLLVEQSHDADVESLAFSPDGRMVVSTGDDATVRFWDAHTGNSLHILREFDHGLVYLSYSMNGNYLLLGTSDGAFQQWAVDDHFVPTTRTSPGFKPDRYEYTEVPASQHISPDGSSLAVINESNLQVFDLETGALNVTLPEFNSSLRTIEYSPDGNLLALVDRNIHLWDVHSRTALGTLYVNRYELTDIAFKPTGDQLAVASSNIQIWDVNTLSEVMEIDTITSQLAYSPDGSTLAAGSWSDVTLWDLKNEHKDQIFQVDLGKPLALSFSSDGERLIFVAQGGFRVWDVSNGKLLYSTSQQDTQINAASIYSRYAMIENLMSCTDGGELHFWNLEDGQPLYDLMLPSCGLAYAAIHPSERLFAYVSGYNESRQILLSDLASGQVLVRISTPNERMESMRFSPDGKLLAAVDSDDAVVHLWDISTASEFAELLPATTATPFPTDTPTPSPTPANAEEIPNPLVTPKPAGPNAITPDNVDRLTEMDVLGGSPYMANPYTAAWSSDGTEFAIGTLGSVYVYTTGTDAPRQSFASGHLVEGLLFSPDERYLAEHNNGDKVIVWDLPSGKRAYTFERGCWGSTLYFSTDSEALTIDCAGKTIRTYDLENGKLISQGESIGYGSPNLDGSLLVSNNSYYTYLRETQSGIILRVFDFQADPWHTVFSPDGHTMLIWYYGADIERTVNGEKQTTRESLAQLWNIVPGQEPILRQTLFTGPGEMEVAPPGKTYVFTSDGKYLITTVWDGFIRIWDTDTGKLVSEIPGGNELFLSSDNRLLLTLDSSKRIELWDLTDIQKPVLFQSITDFETRAYSCPLLFVQDGNAIVMSSGSRIEKWEITRSTLDAQPASYALEFYPRTFAATLDGTYWATADYDGNVVLRSPHNGSSIRTLDKDLQSVSENSFDSEVLRLLFSDNGSVLAAANSWRLWLWDLETDEITLDIHSEFPLGDLALSPDGRLLAFAENNGGRVEIWDTQTGKRLRHFDFAGGEIALSPDGLNLATGWRDGTVWVIDIRTGQTARTMQASGYLNDLIFSPDGALLAINTSDGIQFWDVVQGSELMTIDRYTSCMAFSPDGAIFAVYASEHRIRLWGIAGE